MAPTDASDPRGPVRSRFKVYWNKPSSSDGQQQSLLVLQFPNRKNFQSYSRQHKQQPLELRIKPLSGLVEIDVPIATQHLYDRKKGMLYGRALKRGREENSAGNAGGEGSVSGNGDVSNAKDGQQQQQQQQPVSYGLAGGFGVSVPGRTMRKGGGGGPKRVKAEDEEARMGVEGEDEGESGEEDAEGDGGWREAVEQGMVMDRMTLGGRIQKVKEGDPIYAVGIFHGDELHLTRVKAICSLQPLPHHRDALAEMEKTAARVQLEADGQAPQSVARAVNMTVKSAADDDEVDSTEIAKTLKAIQEESWQRLEWIDQDDERAWQAFGTGLLAPQSDDILVSALSPQQYLDAISAPKVDPVALGRKVLRSKGSTPAEDSFDESTDEEDEEEVMAEEGVRREMEDVS